MNRDRWLMLAGGLLLVVWILGWVTSGEWYNLPAGAGALAAFVAAAAILGAPLWIGLGVFFWWRSRRRQRA